jgi:protein-L-isoaspartate(D-aspartate) O-methyltransferase
VLKFQGNLNDDWNAKMDITEARTNMIKQQFRTWEVLNSDILSLFEKMPREEFVPRCYQHLAFADTPLPLEHGQAMLTPKEEARILDALQIKHHERVLEIGTGSGYFTALLAIQAKHVDSVDIFEDFIVTALQKLQAHHIHNVDLQVGDASLGYKKNTHYDVIIITGSLSQIPKSFLSQLNKNGRLFAFVGKSPAMRATLMTKKEESHVDTQVLFETVVTPLINIHSPSEFVF